MLSAEAHIPTEAPSRYLTQLCSHASSMNSQSHKLARLHKGGPQVQNVEWTDTDGTLTLSIGRCILHAGAGTLTVRVEAADAQGLQQLQELISRDLERFGKRRQLTVTWRQPETTGGD